MRKEKGESGTSNEKGTGERRWSDLIIKDQETLPFKKKKGTCPKWRGEGGGASTASTGVQGEKKKATLFYKRKKIYS